MSCRDFKEVRYLFIDADLSDETRTAYRSHWEHCPECERTARFTLQVLQLVRTRCCQVPAPAELRERILRALNGGGPPHGGRP